MQSEQTRVLFLTARADFGGGPEHLYQLLRNMPESMTAYVACPRDFPYYDRYAGVIGGERIFILPHRKLSLGYLLRLRGFCLEQRINVLHSHGRGGGIYARLLAFLLHLPCVHTFHGISDAHHGWSRRTLFKTWERLAARGTDFGIAVSHSEQQAVLAGGLFPEEKLRLIENGVRIPQEPAWGRAATLPPPPWTVAHITRFTYQKNSELLAAIADVLEAGGRGDDFSFLILGEGPGRGLLECKFTARPDGVKAQFAGAVENPEEYLRKAHCCLSTSRWEGLPLGMLEAMAMGLPVIATDVMGNRDATLHGVNGFLYPDGDAAAAADRLRELFSDAAAYEAMCQNARQTAEERYDVRVMCRKTMNVLSEARRSKAGER